MSEIVSLDDYLEGAGSRPWGFGGKGINCLTLLSGWAHVQTGIDRAEAWANRYRTLAQARALLDREGGVETFMDRETKLCGYRRTTDPEYGDIGLIEVPIEENGIVTPRLIGAICYGPLWVMRDEYALVYADLSPRAAWTLTKAR